MFFSTLMTFTMIPLLAVASPLYPVNTLKPRAGGPGSTPIGANCTLVNPLPLASNHSGNATIVNGTTTANGTINGWKPSDAAMNNTIYSFYLTQPDFVTYASRYEECLEQCNSLDGCKSVLFANNAPTPKGYYGTAGGALDVGCVMFKQFLTAEDFVPAASGNWVNETAANIHC